LQTTHWPFPFAERRQTRAPTHQTTRRSRIIDLSINKAGQIVGTYQDGNGIEHGFLYSHGAYTTLNYPGALGTLALSINDAGQVVGDYQDSDGQHGYLYSHGTYAIDPPGSIGTSITSINKK
jgi:probable HAF family extracellular repeat protein